MEYDIYIYIYIYVIRQLKVNPSPKYGMPVYLNYHPYLQSTVGHEESPSVNPLSHIAVKLTAYILHLSQTDLSFGAVANDVL